MTNDKKLLDGAGRCVAFWYVPARCGSCTLGEARDCYGSRYSDIVRYRGKGKFCYIIKPDKAFCSPGDDSSPCTVIDDTDMANILEEACDRWLWEHESALDNLFEFVFEIGDREALLQFCKGYSENFPELAHVSFESTDALWFKTKMGKRYLSRYTYVPRSKEIDKAASQAWRESLERDVSCETDCRLTPDDLAEQIRELLPSEDKSSS